MTPDQFDELINDEIIRKRLAKWMARDCFRNTKELEDMYADGQLSDDHMKALMTDADYCFDFLMELCKVKKPLSIYQLK
jgi:hypothetical protein